MFDWLKEHVVAAYAAIIATGNLLWTIYQARKDRAMIRLRYQAGMKVLHNPRYDPKQTYLVLTVINVGRRPVTISDAGYQYFGGKKGGIFTDSFISGERFLDEKHPSTTFLAEQSQIEIGRVYWFYAKDTALRTYLMYPHSFARTKNMWWRVFRREASERS